MVKKVDKLDYYREYCIKSITRLNNITDSAGCIKQDIRIYNKEGFTSNPITTLGNIKEIHGHLNIDEIEDLGDLKIVKSHFWYSGLKLKTLNKLERVDGEVNLRHSNIKSLGNLKRVGGRLSLRDSKIENLGCLEYVGGNLFLPKRLEDINLDGIEIKGKVRYWNDKNQSLTSKIQEEIEWDVFNFSNIHNLELKTKKRKLTGEFLVKRCYKLSELNNFIIKNINEFFLFVDNELEILYDNHYSFYEVLFDEIKTTSSINNEFPKNKTTKFINSSKNTPPFKRYFKKLKDFKKEFEFKGYTSKYWLRYDENRLGYCESTGKNKNSFIFFVENMLLQTFSVYVYSLQNEFRVSRGIPKIGEGWVSETELFYLLKEKLPSEKIINHGRPKWLGRQHVDIWFPKHKIGIEYQGLQHDRPVDFFGGEEGFLEGQKRDLKKKKLFKENNSILIEVRKGYELDDIVSQIKKYLK
jgi:hypothetical protein